MNKWVLSWDLKREKVEIFLKSGGREFQSRGAEQLKALLPMVTRRGEGTESEREEEDLRQRDGAVMLTRSERYGGER